MTNTEKQPFSNPEPDTHYAIALWAAQCAEHALHLFETEYPIDQRPRFAIETLRKWVQGEAKMVECRAAAFEAHAAARDATNKASIAAARASGQAAAVAHMYTHAPHAADYAAKAVELSVDPIQSTVAKTAEREWQWEHLQQELRPIGFPKGL